jgi:hypothetical protein
MKSSEEAHLIRPDHPDADVSMAEAPDGFVLNAPEKIPRITVPDLPDDAAGMSAQDLAQVPTLTEQMPSPPEAPAAPPAPPEPAPTVASVDVPAPTVAAPAPPSAAPSAPAAPQAPPVPAESWLQQSQMRINQISIEIHELNDRLDQLEHRPKA